MTLLKSSKDLGWSTLLAELRSHNRYEGPGAAAPTDADVGVVVRGSDEGLLTFKFVVRRSPSEQRGRAL
jgi:AraC family transcriptional regulator